MTTSTVVQPVHWEIRLGGGYCRLMIDRPKGNILTLEVVSALRETLRTLATFGGLKAVALEGAGDHFSFGASVQDHLPDRVGRFLPEFHALVHDLLELPIPTLAVVRGQCLGGGFELALACDILFASHTAMLGVPEVALGVFPPAAAALLAAKVGTARTARAVLTGEARPATRWREMGLVEQVAPADKLQDLVDTWYHTHLGARSAAALGHGARAARALLRHAVTPVLADLERRYLADLMQTRDAREGVTAFLEKRAPVWTDS